MNKEIILQIKDLSVSYGAIKAVKGVNLEIYRGEIVALIGSNGAGKTSLLQAVMNLNKTSGEVFFKGSEITNYTSDRIGAAGISLIPEGHLIFNEMTVMDNLKLGSYHNRKNSQARLEKVFTYFPILKKRKEQIAGSLSGGEQQMLSIGRALMAGPELLLIDEPSLGLAPKIVKDIFNILKELNDEGYTILLAEQNVKKSLQYSSRGYVLETGLITFKGNTGELEKNPAVQRAYLGDSSIS